MALNITVDFRLGKADEMQKIPDDNHPLTTPIYQTSKFSMPSIEELRRLFAGKREGYLYSRFSNPTVRELETTLADMQGCDDAICCASGVAAISSTLLSELSAGDKLLMFIESYKPSRYLANHFLKKFGIETIMASLQERDVASTIRMHKPKLVLFESPTNPTLWIADIEQITKAAKEVGALTVLDNTFAGLGEHHNCGIDVYIHSLSKQANGHGDVIAGAVISSKKWIEKSRNNFVQLGAAMDPNSAFLVLRGLKTFALRAAAQSETAAKVARFLQDSDSFKNVHYPGLESHPQYSLAKKQLKSSGYVISADMASDLKSFEVFIAALTKFHLTGSLGSTESLIAPNELFYGGELSKADVKRAGIQETSFRISVGLEDSKELIEDIKQAVAKSR
jgi:cystathionine beta-lyase/cystathionine gamma-synthase